MNPIAVNGFLIVERQKPGGSKRIATIRVLEKITEKEYLIRKRFRYHKSKPEKKREAIEKAKVAAYNLEPFEFRA